MRRSKKNLGKVEEPKKTLAIEVTQNERRQLMEQVFDMFDKNHDGTVDPSEVKSLLIALGREAKTEDVDKFLDIVDTNKNGMIEKDEFMRAMEECYSIPKDKVADVVNAFKIFDSDEDGIITMKEMKNILLKYAGEFKEEEVEELFKMIDTDANGKISYAEFADIWKFQ